MSAFSDRLYADWLRRNGSGDEFSRSLRRESRSDRLRQEWLDDARDLARQRREADRLRSARRRLPIAGNSVSAALGISGPAQSANSSAGQ